MTPDELLAYFGPAFLYAGAAMLAAFTLLRLAGAQVDGRHALTLFLALFFLALTLVPLPDPATMDCTGGGAPVILQPFAILDHFERLWRRSLRYGWSAELWLGNKMVQATVMNFSLCAAIGAALARHVGQGQARPYPTAWRPWAVALGAGVLLSGGAELAQLTGLFGLYPCAWRTFEVDDLILNIGGLMAGFALVRQWQRRGPAHPQ